MEFRPTSQGTHQDRRYNKKETEFHDGHATNPKDQTYGATY